MASSSASGAMMTSVKTSTIFRALAASSLPVQRDNAAKGRNRIAAQRLEIGLLQRGAFRDAAGVGVLDDRDRRRAGRIEFRDAFEGRVGVVDVIVRELLALDLSRRGDAGALLAGEVEAGGLMRIFAVAHGLRQLSSERPPGRRRLAQRRGEPVGNRRVVSRRAGEGFLREAATRRQRRAPVVRVQFGEEIRVIAGIDQHGHVVVVLGRRADHRRSADVDVLDAFGVGRALRQRRLERIEIDHEQIDRLDVMRQHGGFMLGIFADRQKPAMHLGMQGLEPPVHHLRETASDRRCP